MREAVNCDYTAIGERTAATTWPGYRNPAELGLLTPKKGACAKVSFPMSKAKNTRSTRNPISRERVELPPIPLPRSVNGIDYFQRWDAENYKRALWGQPPLTDKPEKIEFVTIRTLAAELAVHPKTIKRRISEARQAAATAEPVLEEI